MSEYESPSLFLANPEQWGIHFQGDKGEVGKLEFNKHGELHFSGKATESAEVFFTAVIRTNNQEMENMRELAKLGYAVVKDFMPNVGQCALQDYGALNDFMMKAKEEFGE
jgi:hypothetical protein